MRMAFLFRTDVHVADKSPASWKADYPAEVFSCLDQIGDLARKHNVTAVLDGGDFFHIKTSIRNSHGLVSRVARTHSKYPCPTWCLEGNHDMSGNNLDSLEFQPLGVLYATGVFSHLRDHTFEVDGLKVRVVGVPYSPDRTLEDLRSIQKGDEDKLFAVVHSLAGKAPPAHVEEFFGEPVFRYQDLISKKGPDVWMFGHWHQDQGIEHVGGKVFINQGAVSRGALVKENLDRTPKVALIEVEDGQVTVSSIALQVAPSAEVFDLERKDRRDKESDIISQFTTMLEDTVQFDAEATLETNIDQLSFAQEVRTMALEYLTRAREGRRKG